MCFSLAKAVSAPSLASGDACRDINSSKTLCFHAWNALRCVYIGPEGYFFTRAQLSPNGRTCGVSWTIIQGFPRVSGGFRGFPGLLKRRPVQSVCENIGRIFDDSGFPPQLLSLFKILKRHFIAPLHRCRACGKQNSRILWAQQQRFSVAFELRFC